MGKLMRNLLLWSVPTKDMIGTSAALHHLLTLPPEPFQFLDMGLTHHEFEEEDPESWDGQNLDDPNEADYAELITNHMNLAQRKTLEEAVHDDIMPIRMEIISKLAQLDKMKLAQRHIRSWISNDSDKPYAE